MHSGAGVPSRGGGGAVRHGDSRLNPPEDHQPRRMLLLRGCGGVADSPLAQELPANALRQVHLQPGKKTAGNHFCHLQPWMQPGRQRLWGRGSRVTRQPARLGGRPPCLAIAIPGR
jgi:hypothetical protein